ncbi:MAG: hypothetical protein AAB701_00735 [Patescibacteria group bacterium]
MVISCTTDICEIKTKSSVLSLRLSKPTAEGGYIDINKVELPGPGEYEVGEVFAEISARLAHFHIEDMVAVVYRQALGEVTSEDLAVLERVDVLLLLPKSEAKEDVQALLKLSTKVEPRVLILTGVSDVDSITKLEGQTPEVVASLKLVAKDLPEEGQRLYVLHR